MNEQQLQQILTIQQAIAAAATAAVINSLLNPAQQAASGATNPNANALTEALQNAQNQIDLQQHRPDSRQDSPIATSSSPAINTPQQNIDASRLQDLLLQLQQQAASSNGAAANPMANLLGGSNQQQQTQQQQQAALLAALNLNLNNTNNVPLQQQLHSHLAGSPLSQSPLGNRLQLGQSELNLSTATASNIPNQSSPNKKLKSRHLQQPVTSPFTSQQRSSMDATSKPQHLSTPKNHHSTLANLNNNRTNSSNTSSSSSFLPNNVGLPRKLVRGQDVWLGRGAEQTRQILKCMWCGQSFRTLAEMTQHMRETQHYTNIISQEQITSWKQPDGSDPKQNSNKQSTQSARINEDHIDGISDRFNDSEDSFSNDEEVSPSQQQRALKSKIIRSPSIKHESQNLESNNESSSIKPTTRSRKRENEDATNPQTKREKLFESSSQSPDGDNTSHSRVLNNLDENSETKNCKAELEDQDSARASNRVVDSIVDDDEDEEPERATSSSPSSKSEKLKLEDNLSTERESKSPDETNQIIAEDESEVSLSKSERVNDKSNENDEGGMTDDEENKSDTKSSRKRASKRQQIDPCLGGSAKQAVMDGQKVDASGDPLSALETMVEKSFDPRMRPGLASGGILQRLGIDEEVCPPWQHINYANWYAAAAYGHPMAAALLAAGINLQNGIKLGKNVSSKKSDDD